MSGKYEQIGVAPVDSGQLMIVDPCYVLEGDDYERACQVSLSERRSGRVSFDKHGDIELGTVTRTAYGDDVYPVYAKRDEHGRIVELRVWLDDAEDEPHA